MRWILPLAHLDQIVGLVDAEDESVPVKNRPITGRMRSSLTLRAQRSTHSRSKLLRPQYRLMCPSWVARHAGALSLEAVCWPGRNGR